MRRSGKSKSLDLQSVVRVDVEEENVRRIAEVAVGRYEEAYGALSKELHYAATLAARQALRDRMLRDTEGSGKEALRLLFDAAEAALTRVVG